MDSLTELLDDCEHEVDGIRDAAKKIAADQERLESTLNLLSKSINSADDEQSVYELNAVDKEDLNSRIHQLQLRLSTVHAEIRTIRSSQQEKAILKVREELSKLAVDIESNAPDAIDRANSYLDACSKGLGTKFESLLLECSSEDQKEIKQSIESLISRARLVLQNEQCKDKSSANDPVVSN